MVETMWRLLEAVAIASLRAAKKKIRAVFMFFILRRYYLAKHI
jgi:hypothetical protein